MIKLTSTCAELFPARYDYPLCKPCVVSPYHQVARKHHLLRRHKGAHKYPGCYLYRSTRGLLVTDHGILNHGQVTWTTPELAHTLLTTGRTFQLSVDLTRIAALHGGSLVVLGLNSCQGQPRSDTLTTRLPQPREGGAGVVVLFLRAHNDKYQSSALVVDRGRPWLNLLDAKSEVKNCCQSP
ncbi:hypothetical protein TNCV_3532841 [Trichonephila clavipes]|nr:hypothetical protein TNCV_3532841 [Trichonephila clavipes]